jgi:hypothetical protein
VGQGSRQRRNRAGRGGAPRGASPSGRSAPALPSGLVNSLAFAAVISLAGAALALGGLAISIRSSLHRRVLRRGPGIRIDRGLSMFVIGGVALMSGLGAMAFLLLDPT